MILWLYDLKKTIDLWQDKIFHFVDHITSHPAFPAVATLLLFAISCWAISYFSRKG